MADYHAVLQRTLAGFKDPAPQLRGKLYARARTTIRRQLENRQPALDPAAMDAEMDRLEQAIVSIEREHDPSGADGVLGAAAAPKAPSAPPPTAAPDTGTQWQEPPGVPPVVDPLPAVEPPPPAQPAPETEPVGVPPEMSFQVAQPEPSSADPAVPQMPPQAVPVAPTVDVAPAGLPDFGAEAPQPVPPPPPPPPPMAAPEPVRPAPAPATVPTPPSFPPADLGEENTILVTDPPTKPVDPYATDPTDVDALLAQLEAEEAGVATMSTSAAVEPITVQEVPLHADDGSDAPRPDVPPAAGFTPRTVRRRSPMRWLVTAILLLLLAGLAFFGWTQRDALMDTLGLSDLLEDPARPKPVRTITIRPEGTGETVAPRSDESGSATPEAETKVEERLGSAGSEPATLAPAATPAAPAASGPAQTAILYEEGGEGATDGVDSGTVRWSVVQEAPAEGQPPEPAIRARVEIPSRQTVLLMTVKRNADRAFPATHLIELVFATPDDFSGGAVQEINRYVLKESEQGRGEALAGVPARIADGIFMIALDNLDTARERNEQLLRSRDWIDIPLLYRTGRRALMTLEKGDSGKQVFEEVFSAWDSAAG